ncbi:MAG: tetratricopeptide repeat protein, partial [Cyanobacteria bacterium J06636_16]
SPSPALTAGHVTFGSFNNLAKVSPQVVAEWSAILAAVPDSRLIIKAKSLGDTGTQDYLYGLFQQHKIARDRIDLLGRIPSQAEHLALYSRVDIALDTFPYNGTTTTCESLWMGVPVITLAGPTHASRVGVSLLAAVGLSDLIATSVADYRQRAIALAGNLDQLQQLRVTMRDRMQAAPLTNASVITQSIEMAYRTMWHRFCDRARREPDFNRKGMNMLPHEPTAQGQTMDNQCLEIAQHLNQLENPKFILIRAWGHGFWSDVDHVLGQLFLAEITGRIPVVYWGANSRYRDADENAFENYFEPVSSYKIDHLIGQTYTFYPDHWTEETLKDNPSVGDDNLQTNLGARSLPDVVALSRNEDVVVSSSHGYLADLMAQIESEHPFVGQSPQAVYRYLVKKYIKLKPEINRDIEQFWAANLADHPTVAVHIRGSDKIAEVPELTQINQRYHQVIRNCLRRVPDALIFLLTDEISVIEEYQKIYGNKVRFTSAFRTREQIGIHFQSHASPKQRGVEVIKDTYLAAKCDYFVGNGWSNVTATVLHLKDWQKDQHTLVKANVLFRRQAKQPSAAPKSSNSDNTSTQISAQKVQVHSGHQPPKMNSNVQGQTTNVPVNLGNTTQHGGQSSANARRLHIGGKVRVPGWEVLNAVPGPYVDHMGNANDLSRFKDETFTDIYASHLVEHLDYRDELVNTLKEWYRVLAPGGRVYISVPDMDILAGLFISREKLNFSERFMVMRMMFGGHVDQYDYHVVGLNQDFLTMYLKQAGYVNVRRVDRFGLFNDTSNYVFKDVLISLNLIAEKPKQAAASPNQVTMTINELIKLANDLGAQGQVEKAIDYFRQVLAVDPNSFAATVNLGNMLKAQGKYSEALASYRKALTIIPNHPAVENNIGGILKDQGLITEAVDCFYRASTDPSFRMARSNLLLTLNYSDDHEPSVLYNEHRTWADLCATPLAEQIKPFDNEPDPERRVRVGYVSGSFHTHSIAYFFEPLLTAANRSDFEVICYASNARNDIVTQRLQALADGWRDIRFLPDDQVADQIRQDKIDILVDLSGHTNGSRLLVFAYKPAPVQVTYIGYPNTTGLDTMDYRLTDAWADPEGQTETWHIEQLIRLPHGFLCYRPPVDSPEVSPLAATTTGHITFGSFNTLAKVSPQLIGHWSAVLLAVPQSRILIKALPLSDAGIQDSVKRLFEQHGVTGDRIELLGRIPAVNDHLALYNRVDIALDTFPYNGTTTTCEAMWMGVPVVTWAGQTHASRVGVSLLSSVGLKDLIADSAETYVQTAIALAGDQDRLQHLRGTMRDRMQQAPLTNAELITPSVEDA